MVWTVDLKCFQGPLTRKYLEVHGHFYVEFYVGPRDMPATQGVSTLFFLD